MKTRIIASLALLFALFTSGSVLALLTLESATDLFGHVVNLHQIEDLRRQLLAKVFKVQTDLFTFATTNQADLTATIEDAVDMNAIAEKCAGCHHAPAVAARLEDLRRSILDYQSGISFYMTASASTERAVLLKQDAALIGSSLLSKIQAMSAEASAHLAQVSASAEAEARRGKILLAVTFFLTCLVGALVAVNLTRSITRPVNDIVDATRVIAEGKLGYTISRSYKAEFGELVRSFNSMSASLKSDQDSQLQELVERRKVTVSKTPAALASSVSSTVADERAT